MVKRPIFKGNLASNCVNGVIFPVSNAIAVLKIFAEDPGSIADDVTILKRVLSFGSDFLFGSKSGSDTNEIISPVAIFITTAAPPIA